MIIFLLLLSFCLAEVTSTNTCDSNPYTNGCSMPAGWTWYEQRFTPACNKHDVCYKCGYTRGISRSRCDLDFKQNMESTCPRKKGGFFSSNHAHYQCLIAATMYYAGVRTGGGLPLYWNYQKYDFCWESWVNPCMP